jgi:hypothetical protein
MSVLVSGAPLVSNSFTQYALTPEQELQGSVLTPLQLMVLHNQLTALAEEKISLKFDPDNIYSFAQREAELTGQIGILRYLIETSEAIRTNQLTQSVATDTNNPI